MTTAYERSQESAWQLPHPLAVRRLATSLVDDAHARTLAGRYDGLHRLAREEPGRLAELALALAQLAAVSLAPPPGPSDDPARRRRLRKAHAAHWRGIRVAWVIEGEREYQREMKRRKRAARSAAHRSVEGAA